MEIKKFAFLVLIALLLIAPLASAEQTNSSLTETDANEVATMASPHGAEVRLLQLEKAITKNVLIGEKVLDVIAANHPDANISDAEASLEELKSLVEEVKALPTEGDGNELAQQFVEIKKESITLAQDFKTETKDYLEAEDMQEIKEYIKTIQNDKNVSGLNQRIMKAIKEHNATGTLKIFGIVGITDEALIQRVNDGNATRAEIKEAVRKALQDMTPEERKMALQEFKELGAKRKVAENAAVVKAKEKLRERILEREARRLGRRAEVLHKIAQKIRGRK
ncbi:MAG: hypothetical protein NTZ73_00385 [Candidatus Diapherotrites archaeon]|nr:hypothetical protein [Candidatus Diapherotrites archaeon]